MNCRGAAALIAAGLFAHGARAVSVPHDDPNLQFVGRFLHDSSGSHFDMNGCEIRVRVEGATEVTVHLGQQHTPPGVGDSPELGNPIGSQPNDFLVYIDGVAQNATSKTCQYCTFDTSDAVSSGDASPAAYTVAANLSTAAHDIRIFKATEPDWNTREPRPNWMTFTGLTLDAGHTVKPAKPLPERRLEFIGDSITAGYCNLCKGPAEDAGYKRARLAGGESSETFALSWANRICEKVGAQCHTVAWSGLGMIHNCCGGDVLMPEIFRHTLASAASTPSDALWDFSQWKPAGLVVNLGTNDGGTVSDPNYAKTYLDLVMNASKAYGPDVHFFLACGPMTDRYCPYVEQVIANATTAGVKASLFNQTLFDNGQYGPTCCGHPGAQIDEAIAEAGAATISKTLGWN